MVIGRFTDVICSLCCVGTWPSISEVSLHRDLIVILNVMKAQISSDNCYSVLLFHIIYCFYFCLPFKIDTKEYNNRQNINICIRNLDFNKER